jgi:murein DD-endopeptidase MepM/ murein hydrolase activator NlpD
MSRQMAHRVDAPRRRPPTALLAAIAAVIVVTLFGAMFVLGGHGPSPSASNPAESANRPDPSNVASESASPRQSARTSEGPRESGHPKQSEAPGQSAVPSPSQSSPASATTEPSATSPGSQTPAPNAAPTSPAGFDLQGQVVDIGFPLRADTVYHYRDNWYERRAGPPDAYNHAKVGADGQLVRLHDGIDIYAPENEPVLAPFDGTIIDPASKWTPWEPDRYGLTVVVQSDESTSNGYYAVLVHLDKVWVEIGQHVTRGQVIGVLGKTGNAEEVAPQLHFELRAPFELDWSPIGEDRMVDAFNPYPSLVAADPKPH